MADAVLDAGFTVINSQPVKSEMAVATPKSAAKEPIAFDIILVCRKQLTHPDPKRQRGSADTNPKRERGECASTATCHDDDAPPVAISDALTSARSKIDRLLSAGFALSRNDRKIILYGQLLTTLAASRDATTLAAIVDAELSRDEGAPAAASNRPQQQELFERV